jgi:hypothetical protein
VHVEELIVFVGSSEKSALGVFAIGIYTIMLGSIAGQSKRDLILNVLPKNCGFAHVKREGSLHLSDDFGVGLTHVVGRDDLARTVSQIMAGRTSGLTSSATMCWFPLQFLDELLELRSVAKRVKVGVGLEDFRAEMTSLDGAA